MEFRRVRSDEQANGKENAEIDCSHEVPPLTDRSPALYHRHFSTYAHARGEFMTKTEMIVLFKYDAWATDHQLAVIKNLSDAQYEKDLGSSHRGIQGTITHMNGADRVWLARWTGKGPNAMPDGVLPQAGLRERWTI